MGVKEAERAVSRPFLINRIARCACDDDSSATLPLLNVCVQAGSAEEVASLLDMGANVNWRSADCGGGDTALLAAVRNGHCTVAGMLLAMGADPTVTSPEY